MDEFNAVAAEELSQVDGGTSALDALSKPVMDEIRKAMNPRPGDLVVHST